MIIILSGVKFYLNMEEFETEKVNDEIVLYFKKIKKAMILNKTCSMIWSMVSEYQREDGELSDEQIADYIMEQFGLPEEERNNIICDILELFPKLLEERVIHMKAFIGEGAEA